MGDLDAGRIKDEFIVKQLTKRAEEERNQARHFNWLLGTNISVRQAQFSSECSGGEHVDSKVERLLIERVALAKIAREVKKLQEVKVKRRSKITQVQHVEAPVGQSPAPQDESRSLHQMPEPLFVPAAAAPLAPPEPEPAGLIVDDVWPPEPEPADVVRLVPDPAG